MTNTFKLALPSAGNDPDDWDILSEIMVSFEPDWEFDKYSGSVDLDDGSVKGTGLPAASWHVNGLREEDRSVLRTYCPEEQISSDVFVMTPTNETDGSGDIVWIAAAAQMRWVSRREEKDQGVTLGFDLEFSMMVAV